MDSLREATAARHANEQVLEIDPNLVDARLVLGVNQYVVGSLPFYMKLIGFLNGFHGDKEGGIRELEMVAEHGVQDKFDAKVLLAVIYRRERRPEKAIPLLEELAARFPRNYLFLFEQVQMYSDLGDKQSACESWQISKDVDTSARRDLRSCPLKSSSSRGATCCFGIGILIRRSRT